MKLKTLTELVIHFGSIINSSPIWELWVIELQK